MRKETASILGESVGHIRVINLIGEGGMGAVYAGFDDKLERHVALKAIHSDFRLNPQSKARFLREARILSQLDHPSICTIHDYVEGDTNDFLVMELIDGRNLRKALRQGLNDETKMEIARDLLEVLVEVHSQGVIHRDLKPENIMITPEYRIKVLDFGLSRSAEEDAAFTHAETLSPGGAAASSEGESVYVKTSLGTILGTAGYMSPEQARGEPATAASDMYSVGLVLQELFTGERPFEEGLIGEELVKKAALGETSTPTGLSPDLTELINRLKSVAPGTRPSSVDALERFQHILEKPKRRLKRLAVVAAFTIVTIVAGAMSYQAYRIGQANKRANQEAETARQVSEFLVDLFAVSDPGEAQGNTVTARELLDKGAAKIDKELVDQPLVRARLLNTIGTVYQKLGLFNEAEELLEGALKLRQENLDSTHPDLAITLRALADTYDSNGAYDRSQTHYERALAIQEQSLGPDDPEVAITLRCLSNAHANKAEYDEALALLQRALAIHEKTIGSDHPEYAVTFNNFANIHLYKGDYDQAAAAYEEALAIQEASLGPGHPDLAVTLNNLAIAQAQKGALDRAQVYFERVVRINEKSLGPDHPDLASNLTNLAAVHFYQGNYDQAALFHRRALTIQERSLGPRHPSLATTLGNLAGVHKENGEYNEAEALYERALAIREEALGPNHPEVAGTLSNLSAVLIDKGDYGRALPLLQRALAIQEESLGPQHHDLASVLANLAVVYKDSGVYDQARASFERALAISEQSLGPDHSDVASLLNSLALVHNEKREFERAEALQRRALSIAEKSFEGSDHPLLAHLLCDHALTCLELRRYEESEAEFRRSLQILEAHRAEGRDTSGDRRDEAKTLYGLARVHQALRRTQQARDTWARVLEILGPIAATTDNESLSIYGRTLLHLGRSDEATLVNERLLSSGYRNRAYLDVLREHGIVEAQSGG